MTSSTAVLAPDAAVLRRVVILADESANWKIAGLRQLDRLLLSLREYARTEQPGEIIDVRVQWQTESDRALWPTSCVDFDELNINAAHGESVQSDEVDLVISTRLLLYRGSLPRLLAELSAQANRSGDEAWQVAALRFEASLHTIGLQDRAWSYVASKRAIPASERSFLSHNGKSQDGLVSRYLNRPLSRMLSRWLLKLPLAPSNWSLMIFALPICASFFLSRGTFWGFVIGCGIFQLYSIVDGCDGEIARSKFMQTESGRRLDSVCDLIGNLLLAFSLGVGLARQANGSGWFYVCEGIAAAALTLTSEGIVFLRRSRGESTPRGGKWHGVLYQRHHEFLERSGILFIGENFAWWLVQLTKRDMAMLAFLLLAAVGLPSWNLHLLFAVGAVSSVLAGNAFLRQPATPAVAAQEAS